MTVTVRDHRNLAAIKGLTYLMFMMFAMTTDSVGVIIPEVIKEFDLSMTAAGAFHYTSMTAIGLSGVLLGHLADRLGNPPGRRLCRILVSPATVLRAQGPARRRDSWRRKVLREVFKRRAGVDIAA